MEYYKPEPQSNIRWVVAIVLAGLFILDLWIVITGMSGRFDADIMAFAYSIRVDYLTEIFRFLTRAGDIVVIVAICAVLVALPTRIKFGIPVSAAVFIMAAVQYVIKHLVERARPDEAMWLIPEDGFSFTSGHAGGSFVFYLFLMVLLRRYLILGKSYSAANLVSVVMPLLVAFIGISRIYLGVHYPTDVIGAWLLGGIFLIVLVSLYDRYYPLKHRLTFDAPSWEYSRRRRPWRKPQVNHPAEDLLDFPKNRSKWRRPNTTKRRPQEEERQ